MDLQKTIKILCILNDVPVDDLAKSLEFNSRQLLYHHIKKKNTEVLKKLEKIFNLKPNSLVLNTIIVKVIS